MRRDYIASDELITLNRKTKRKAYWCKQYDLSEQEFDRLYSMGKSPRQIFGLKTKASKQNLYTIKSATMNVSQWCSYYKISRATFYRRLKKGMSAIEAFKTPTSNVF